MTLPPLPDLREAFEAYFSNSRRGRGVKKIPVFKRLPDDTYADEPTQRHWWTWQNAARAAIATHAGIAAVPAQPVAWMDDFGNVFPLAANKGAGSWMDDHKRNWKPLYAAPQAVPVPAWQPIETAPKDGRRVLVWIDEKSQAGCAFAKLWFYSSGRLGGGAEGYSGDWNITHWMPLPAAPKEQP